MCGFTQWNIYSAIKKKEKMLSVVTWKDLEIIILSEVSQSQNKYYMIIPMVDSKMCHESICETGTDLRA